MKVNSLLIKTALAAAVASVSFGATAGVLQIPNPSILATEIFGDAKNNANESDLTAITLPLINFYADVGGALATATDGAGGPAGAGSHEATIKLTLLGAALFAENYQDPNQWASQGIELQVNGTVVTPGDITSVDAGTGNDNTITITLTNGGSLGDVSIASTAGTPAVSIKGLKVKRLKQQLQTAGGTSSVTLEVRAKNDTAGNALAAEAFENTESTVAFVSTPGVVLAGTRTDYTLGASSTRGYIQVGDAQQSFTNAPTAGHRDDFDSAVAYLNLGTLAVRRGVVPAGVVGAGLEAGKETGTKFDFTGADTLSLSVTADNALAPYGLEIRTDACTNAGTAAGRVAAGSVAAATPNTATFAVTTTNVNLDAPVSWNLCGVASVAGTDRIPQLGSLAANLKVEYGNVRYGESLGVYEYGEVLRNGCQVTLFNLPNVTAADKAMIRLTNTSDKDGQVNAYIWTEDGRQLDLDVEVEASLVAHGTQLFHTNPNLSNGVYLGDVLPEFGAEDAGRARIILQGAFPSCEALGLVRSPNGTLTNMTSTTNSSGATAGTSNTSN